jgi:hypothetical protein
VREAPRGCLGAEQQRPGREAVAVHQVDPASPAERGRVPARLFLKKGADLAEFACLTRVRGRLDISDFDTATLSAFANLQQVDDTFGPKARSGRH